MTAHPAPPHGFPPQEFHHRLARAQALMHEARLDALLLTTPQHLRYFTGFASEFWESPTRPWFLVIPAEGAPVAVIPEIGASTMAQTWISDIRAWPAPRPEDDGLSLLTAALVEPARRFGRIGAELGREMALRMPAADFLALRGRLSGVEIVDASPCLWRLRGIKSPAEIDRIRHACAIAGASYAALPTLARIGDSEREIRRRLQIDLLTRGADSVPFLPVIAGPGGVAQIVCGPGERRIEAGDILFADTGATYDGYFCDFDRLYAVGQIDDAARRAYDAVWEAVEAGLAAARPGVSMETVWRAMAARLGAGDAPGGSVGRLGHGLGMQLTEPPSFAPGQTVVIEPGMVLTIEPGFEYAPGKMIVLEENVAVTETGLELLTERAPRAPLLIGCSFG